MQDDDLIPLRERREWLNVREELIGSVPESTRRALTAEARAPFRFFRTTLSSGLLIGASLGLVIIGFRLIAALQGGRDAPPVQVRSCLVLALFIGTCYTKGALPQELHSMCIIKQVVVFLTCSLGWPPHRRVPGFSHHYLQAGGCTGPGCSPCAGLSLALGLFLFRCAFHVSPLKLLEIQSCPCN
jgi:hypothetical protein